MKTFVASPTANNRQRVNEHQVWLDDPDWREQVEEAFKRDVSVSLIARPDARGDLKSAILGFFGR